MSLKKINHLIKQSFSLRKENFLVTKRLFLALSFSGLTFFLVLSLIPKDVLAWTEPSASPPGGNVAAPLNTSSTTQTKSGKIEIGTATPILNPGLPYALNLESNTYPLVLTDPNAGAGNKRWGFIFDGQGNITLNRAADDLGGINYNQVKFYRGGETEFRGGVGINTKPTYPTFLEIAGNAIDEPWIVFRPVQANHIGAIDVRSGDGLGIKMDGLETARITSSGNFSIRTPGEDNYLFLETANSPGQYYDIGAFGNNAFQPLRIDGSVLALQTRGSGTADPGQVGIGTTNPQAKLQVNSLTNQNDISFGKAVSANYTPGFGNPSVITDGAFVPEGTRWNDCLDWNCPPNSTRSVQLNDSGTGYALTIDLNGTYNVSKIKIQADVNDTYIIEYSPDGTNWNLLYKVSEDWAHIVEGGLRTREFELLNKVSARYVRVYAYDKGAGHEYGDDYLSVSELQVFENANALAVTDQGRVGIGTTNPKSRLQINDNYNLAAGKTAVLSNPDPSNCSVNPVSADPSVITDDQYAAEGADWRDIKAIWLYDQGQSAGPACNGATLTINLGGNYNISGAMIQADSNDAYTVEHSPDGNTWSELFTAPPGNGGLSTRASESLGEGLKKVSAHYVRVKMTGGDGRFSISELEVLQSPLPNTFMVTDQGRVGIGADPSAKLTVTTNLGKIGSLGDTLYTYANSGNAAISAEQGGSGYAGYFAAGTTSTHDTLAAFSSSVSKSAIYGEQANATGWAGYFSGNVKVTNPTNTGKIIADRLCLGNEGNCQSSWDSMTGFWKQNAGGTSISPNDNNWSVGIGGTPPAQTKLFLKTGLNEYGWSHTTGQITLGSWVGAAQGVTGGWLGTDSNNPLVLYSRGNVRMNLETTGRVSVGETNRPPSTSDTLVAYSNSSSGKSAVYAQQDNASGWAGYFSGKVKVIGNLYATSNLYAGVSGNDASFSYDAATKTLTLGSIIIAQGPSQLAIAGNSKLALVSPPSRCNNNGVCEPPETPQICPSDCLQVEPQIPVAKIPLAQAATFIPEVQAATQAGDKIYVQGGNLRIDDAGGANTMILLNSDGSATFQGNVQANGSNGVLLTSGQGADIKSSSPRPLHLNTDVNADVVLVGGSSTGKVGIGTTPGAGLKLDVAGTTAVDYLRVDPQDETNEGGEIQLKGTGIFGDFQIDNYQGNARIVPPDDKNFQLQLIRGTISAGGIGNYNYFANYVGIGTPTPNSILDVRGDMELVAGATSWGEGLKILSGADAEYGGIFWGYDRANIEWSLGRINSVANGAARNDLGFFNKDWTGSSLNIAGRNPPDLQIYLDKSSGATLFGGNVGVGTTAPNSKLSVGGNGVADTSIYGKANQFGVYGETTGDSGQGVYGAGKLYGVHGITTGTGIGVYGEGGGNIGVQGESNANNGRGVYGVTGAAGGSGVYGETTANSGTNNFGVYGKAINDKGWAGYFDGDVKAGRTLEVVGDLKAEANNWGTNDATYRGGPQFNISTGSPWGVTSSDWHIECPNGYYMIGIGQEEVSTGWWKPVARCAKL